VGGTLQIIDHVVKAIARGSRPIVDRVSLTWDERQKSRQKLQTAEGREVALALPTGTRLNAGDLLPVEEGWIEVGLAPEEVLLIRPRTLQEAAFVAYQVGNRHLSLEITDDGLKTLYEPVLASYLCRQGIPVEQTHLPFTPVSAMSGHGDA
jgi:urease accessory protein